MKDVQNQQAQANNNTDTQSPQVEPQVQNQEPGRLPLSGSRHADCVTKC